MISRVSLFYIFCTNTNILCLCAWVASSPLLALRETDNSVLSHHTEAFAFAIACRRFTSRAKEWTRTSTFVTSDISFSILFSS